MDLAAGSRLAAVVLGIAGAGVALLMGLGMLLFGGVIDMLEANNGASIALSACIIIPVAVGGLWAAWQCFRPNPRLAVAATALEIVLVWWAFDLVDAWELALVPVVPLAGSVLFGLAAVAHPAPQEAR